MPHFDGRREQSSLIPHAHQSPDETAGSRCEALAVDHSHGVVGAAFGVLPQAVYRDDAGVLQVAGDLRLQHEWGGWVASPAKRGWISLSATSRWSWGSRAQPDLADSTARVQPDQLKTLAGITLEDWVEPDGPPWPIGRVASHPNVLLNVIRRPSSPISVSTSIVSAWAFKEFRLLRMSFSCTFGCTATRDSSARNFSSSRPDACLSDLSERRLGLLRPRVQSRGKSVPTNRIRQDREDGDNEIAIRVIH